MLRTIVVAIAGCMSLAVVQNRGAAIQDIQDLTVPPWRLPSDCALSPATVQSRDGSARRANWAGLAIPTNPWIGTDKPLLATIRERLGGTPPTPDGPPLTPRQNASYRLHLAEGVEEGYTAVYAPPQQPESSRIVVVYGLRFSEGAMPIDSGLTAEATNPRIARVWLGRTLVVVHGHNAPCFKAIATHLQSLQVQK